MCHLSTKPENIDCCGGGGSSLRTFGMEMLSSVVLVWWSEDESDLDEC